jgi:hypothetical protein
MIASHSSTLTHSLSPQSLVTELKQRSKKLEEDARELGQDEGVWLENSRMLIDYNFKHGVPQRAAHAKPTRECALSLSLTRLWRGASMNASDAVDTATVGRGGR